MKKIFALILAVWTLCLLVACAPDKYTVTYMLDGEPYTEEYEMGTAPLLPQSPERAGHVFCGWAHDPSGKKPYVGGTPLEADTTLYPIFAFDAESAVNRLFGGEIEMSVEIRAEGYDAVFGIITGSESSQGSGVICRESDGFYYCLTNAHVIDVALKFNNRRYTVTDCYGNAFAAELVASDAARDLALLRFEHGTHSLHVPRFAESDVSLGDTVIALGAPDGMDNSVTFGRVTRVDTVSGQGATEQTAVAFPVIWHNAPMAHGSSGGALLNDNMELVGVNFAIATNGQNGEYLYGFCIPISYVREFLNANFTK